MSELELSLGIKIVLSQLVMTITVALAGDAISYDTGNCSWYNVGMIFAYNAGVQAFLTPLLEYLRLIDFAIAHPNLNGLCCYDATSDVDQMFPAYMLTLYKVSL